MGRDAPTEDSTADPDGESCRKRAADLLRSTDESCAPNAAAHCKKELKLMSTKRPPQRRNATDEPTRSSEPVLVVPPRDEILRVLADTPVPQEEAELATRMKVAPEALDAFHRRLNAMARDGQLLRNRKGAILVADKLDLIGGRVSGHPDGHGYVAGDDGIEYVLAPREMNQVLHGDRVLVRPGRLDRRGRREAAIVQVLERAQRRIVGRFHRERGVSFVIAADRRITQDVLIEPEGTGGARPGQVVTVDLVGQPTKYVQPIGRIIEVLGQATDPGMEIEIALRKHQLPFEFSRAAQRRAEQLPDAIRPADRAARTDFTATPFVTIDGETAKDFDDAVYCEPDGKGYRLLVAIADVSHYVRHRDPLDRDAHERGTSVYFPRRVIPMLPEKLSNGLCSLNPEVERLVLVCEMHVSRTGKIGPYKFCAGVIRSVARLTYTQVAHSLYGGEAPTQGAPIAASLLAPLRCLDEVFRALARARAQRGALDFESTETELLFDQHGKIESIRAIVRNDAHRLIEECMLAANVCAAEYLATHEQGLLYRVHEGPTPEKLETLREYLGGFGLALGGGDKPQAKDYAKLIDAIKERPERALLHTMLLRSLRQAIYSANNAGHFGLAYPAYAHFTSPIRRYPDLLVHRAIKAVVAGERYDPGDWAELGEHSSSTERRADEAARDVVQWLKCYYMKDRVNDEFDGLINGVTGFGIFVTLESMYVEGLVHIAELGNDYFHFESTRLELRGERTGRVFRLGARVKVRVAHVDLDLARIDFRLVG